MVPLLLYFLAAPWLLWSLYEASSNPGFLAKFVVANSIMAIVIGTLLLKRRTIITLLPRLAKVLGVGSPLEEMYFGIFVGIMLFVFLIIVPLSAGILSLEGGSLKVVMWLTFFSMLSGPGITSTMLYPLYVPGTRLGLEKKIDLTINFMRIHSNLIIVILASILFGTITGKITLSVCEVLFALYCAVGDYIGCFGRHCVVIEELTQRIDRLDHPDE